MRISPSSYHIKANARPGDVWRLRMLQCLGSPRIPNIKPRFHSVIYKPERLGDFFLAKEAIRTLVRHWGEEQTALVVSPECMILAEEEFPRLVKYALPLSLGSGGWNFFEALALHRELAEYSCENLVCLRHHRQPLSLAALRWIPAQHRWGTTKHPWMPATSAKAENGQFERDLPYPWPGESGIPTEIQAHADVVEQATGLSFDTARLLPKIHVEHKSASRPVLQIVPWGSGGIKNLTGELIVQIIRGINQPNRFAVRIISESKRHAELEALLLELRESLPGIDIAHQPTANLQELEATLAKAAAILTADTYPAHLAIAMDKPVAIINTGALPGVFGPWSRSDQQRWFVRELDCWGCGWRCNQPKPLCLLEIEPGAVAQFLSPYLSESLSDCSA